MTLTSAEMWKQRQRKLDLDETRECQCKLGELFRPPAGSRPDTCTRLAALAAGVNQLQVFDVRRIKDFMCSVDARRGSLVLKFNPDLDLRGICRAGRSAADHGDEANDGKCRVGYLFGLTPSTIEGSCRLSH